jgi:hypothetical protein
VDSLSLETGERVGRMTTEGTGNMGVLADNPVSDVPDATPLGIDLGARMQRFAVIGRAERR